MACVENPDILRRGLLLLALVNFLLFYFNIIIIAIVKPLVNLC